MRTIIFFVLFLLFVNLTNAQQDTILARIGEKELTLREFRERFMFTPQIMGKSDSAKDSVRKAFLYSLIAEKLWAIEGEKNRFDSTEAFRETYPVVEKMIVRDAVFRREIQSLVKITDEEILKEFGKANTLITFRFIFSADSVEIYALFDSLMAGVEFDSILKNRTEAQFQAAPLQYEYGKGKKSVANILYKMGLPGQISKPFKDTDGWFIFRLEERKSRHLNKSDNYTLISQIKQSLEEEKTDSLYQVYYRKLLGGRKIEATGTLFWSLAEKLTSLFEVKKTSLAGKGEKTLRLEAADFRKFKAEFGKDTLAMNFILLDNAPVSFHEFLSSLFFEGFYTDTIGLNIIASKLNARIRTFIEQELVFRNALANGAMSFPEVQYETQMWKSFFYFQTAVIALLDSLENSETLTKDGYRNTALTLFSFVTPEPTLVEKLYSRIASGDNFQSAATALEEEFPESVEIKEMDTDQILSDDELQRIVYNLTPGSVYGPFPYKGKLMVCLLKETLSINQDSSRFNNYRSRADNFLDILNTKTAQLAEKYGINVNANLLSSEKTENLQMVVFRYFGFGGRMPAFPLSTNYIHWLKKYNGAEKLP